MAAGTTVKGSGDGSAATNVKLVSTSLTARDRWAHFAARWGVNRSGRRVEPGLYRVGNPSPDSPVFVSANYTLSFDVLRSALAGIDGYILVLDTDGINVWCAAGKGTFGTDELVQRIEATGLKDIVSHRVLILPQLGAPGVAAHEVKQRTGFTVEYGPVRATDIPGYLKTHKATPEMRTVRFDIRDRIVLVPVEIVHGLMWLLIAGVAIFFLNGMRFPLVAIVAFLAGLALFPILLPWLPTREFSTKGFILGAVAVLPFALARLLSASPGASLWRPVVGAASTFLIWVPVVAFLALNFTGSSTFTSRTGVRREIFRYVPVMAWTFGVGVALELARAFVRI